MDPGLIGLQLMDLYGKLRRASDQQVRRSLEARIDELVAEYEREERAAQERAAQERRIAAEKARRPPTRR